MLERDRDRHHPTQPILGDLDVAAGVFLLEADLPVTPQNADDAARLIERILNVALQSLLEFRLAPAHGLAWQALSFCFDDEEEGSPDNDRVSFGFTTWVVRVGETCATIDGMFGEKPPKILLDFALHPAGHMVAITVGEFGRRTSEIVEVGKDRIKYCRDEDQQAAVIGEIVKRAVLHIDQSRDLRPILSGESKDGAERIPFRARQPAKPSRDLFMACDPVAFHAADDSLQFGTKTG